MANTLVETQLAELLNRREIADVIYRYARAIDRMDFDMLRECYHPDAYDDHGAMSGSVDEFIESVRVDLPRFECTMHFLGNMLIEFFGDVARSETYAVAYQRRQASDGSIKDDVWGIRYVDRFEQRSGQWRIAHRVLIKEWRRVDLVSGGNDRSGAGEWGRRDGSDALFRILDSPHTDY